MRRNTLVNPNSFQSLVDFESAKSLKKEYNEFTG